MILRRFILLFCLMAGARLMGDGAPIPPDVWAMKDDAGRTGEGAVILEKTIRLGSNSVEYDYRVRIFSERGKRAGHFPRFPEDTMDMRGRTVLPDGKDIPFCSSADFHSKTLVAAEGWEERRKVMVAPGLTEDCVLDLHWREPRHYTAWFFRSEAWDLAEPFPVKVLRIEIPQDVPYYYAFTPDRKTPFETDTADGRVLITLKDLRAMEELPYSLKVTRDFPRLRIGAMDLDIGSLVPKGGDAFWGGVARRCRAFYIDQVRRGRPFRLFSETLRKGLPEGPQAKAREIYRRLNTRILNLDQLSYEEKSAMSRTPAPDPREFLDLDQAVRKGHARFQGMRLLYVHLLLDEGIHPLLVQVADRNKHRFSKKELNIFQFDQEYLAIEEPDKPTLWVFPGLRLAPPGFVFQNYQGTSAFGIDTANWTPCFLSVPAEPAEANQARFAFTLDLQEDQDLIAGTFAMTGQSAIAGRQQLFDKEPAARTRLTKEGLERATPSFTLKTFDLENVLDPSKDLVLHLEGRMDRERGRLRTVNPFPFMSLPFLIPKSLPPSRTEPIVLPCLLIHTAVSRFKVPKGCVLAPTEPLDKENLFGTVSWKAVQGEGGQVEVTLRIEAKTFSAKGAEMEPFKAFLAWVKDACTRNLFLEKP